MNVEPDAGPNDEERGQPHVPSRAFFRFAVGELDERTLERYVGTYELSPNYALTVSREKNEIYLEATGQGKAPIFAMGPGSVLQ